MYEAKWLASACRVMLGYAMTCESDALAERSVPSLDCLCLEESDPEPLRAMMGTEVAALISAEAAPRARPPIAEHQLGRVKRGDDYRERPIGLGRRSAGSRLGTMRLQIPRLRAGSYLAD